MGHAQNSLGLPRRGQMPFWSHKSWFLPESRNWFPIPCWTSGFLRFVTKLKLNKHFNMLASYRSSMFFVQKTELTLGISISAMELWEEQGTEKYFVRDQKSAAQRWNRTPFALSPKKIPALYQGGRGLGRVSPSPLWWGERAGKAFVFLLKCWMLFSQSFQRIGKHQSLSYLLSCRNLICLWVLYKSN